MSAQTYRGSTHFSVLSKCGRKRGKFNARPMLLVKISKTKIAQKSDLI